LDKTDDYVSMKYPETPVNLPANKATAEFGSDVMTDVISDMGFKHIFVLPGSSFRGIHDSLVNHLRNQNPEMIMCNHESIVVAMAHGYAKASGDTAACVVHDLVGLMCASVSVFDAWVDRVPVLVFGGSGPQDPARRRPIDWTHTASMQCDLVKPFTKWTAEPVTLQAAVDSMLRANKIAGSKPSGPTYVSLDLGLQEDPLPADLVVPDANLERYQTPAPMAANTASVERAVDMLLAANNPLIVGGRFGRDVGTSDILTELVELSGASYIEDRAVVCMATAHPQNINGDPKIREEADLIFSIDCVDTVTVANAHNKNLRGREGQQIIEMTLENLTPSSWSNVGGPQAAVDLQIDCEPVHGMSQIIEALKTRLAAASDAVKKIDARKAEIGERHTALRQAQVDVQKEDWDSVPISTGRLTHELYQAVKDKPWVLPVRNHRSFPEGLWDFTGSGQYLGADGGGGVGYGPAAAVGAALVYREQGKLPVAIMGDGDFQMGSGAIWTAVHYKIPLLIVINNNNSWGNDEFHQRNIARKRGRPVENAWIGQRMAEPATDYATIVHGYGGWAEGPVEDPAQLPDVFARAISEVEKGNVAVVDVRTGL
jgi:acetolactate synthase I/II/III large subunit